MLFGLQVYAIVVNFLGQLSLQPLSFLTCNLLWPSSLLLLNLQRQ